LTTKAVRNDASEMQNLLPIGFTGTRTSLLKSTCCEWNRGTENGAMNWIIVIHGAKPFFST
jgi:hypothetical protein